MNNKTTQRRIVRSSQHTCGLARNFIKDGSITRFQEFRAIFHLTRMAIRLSLQLRKLAGSVSHVAIHYRSIASTDLDWVVQDNHLSSEASCFHWWVIFPVTSNIAMMNIFDRYVLDVEAPIVPRKNFTQSFMVYCNRFGFSCNIDWSQGDLYADTSLHLAYRDSTNTTNFVDILERQTQGLVSWTNW
uniref:cDNA FLJ26160 fis, clone ADG02164 n=1 Tax=Homo sapiens TaxID=9606 RepID=Q6ZPA6_HUMAN|nr:unnamed protein product [Homo sapiens]